MNIARWLLRIAAVVSSLGLVSIYVYDRAGGTFLRQWISGPTSSTSNERQPPVLFGSEAAPTLTPPKDWEQAILPTAPPPVVLPGPKSYAPGWMTTPANPFASIDLSLPNPAEGQFQNIP